MSRLLIGIFFIFISVSYSQNVNDNVFSLKPSLGINVCQVHGDNFSGYNKPGIFGGLAINAQLNEKLSLELGFYFSQKGAWKSVTKTSQEYFRLNFNYIDLPLSLRYMVNNRYFITAGPSLAYLINYNVNYNFTNISSDYTFKKYEVGVNIGLGRTIVNNFSVEVRCSNSIVSVMDYGVNKSTIFYPNAVARFFNKGLYNNILTIMLTYKLDKKKHSEEH
jgi:hypothetical protein